MLLRDWPCTPAREESGIMCSIMPGRSTCASVCMETRSTARGSSGWLHGRAPSTALIVCTWANRPSLQQLCVYQALTRFAAVDLRLAVREERHEPHVLSSESVEGILRLPSTTRNTSGTDR